ncbi:CNBP [Mytilus edulis]|uniref:CNBP n=1 Tax=Mytilus edulis TaxID=6550 RepID=A0A8S3PR60_MYTED|nr:CNBP [Mytilus edulis]
MTPRTFASSKEIRKEIAKHPILEEKIQYAYSLPRGGIALHFTENHKVDSNNIDHLIPTNLFGNTSKRHIPNYNNQNQQLTGFLRNIPLNCNVLELRDKFESKTNIKILNIHQLRYWDTKICMPIAKIKFRSEGDLQKAIKLGLFKLVDEKKEVFVERKRVNKVTRCYNCHRFGHSQVKCTLPKRCYNCGQENCTEKTLH